MTNFELSKRNYERGLWTNTMLQKLVEKGKLTPAEYFEIVGEKF